MSRAFLRDDAEGEMPRRNYDLPHPDDPEFDRAAARALLEAARVNETQLAERATGLYWGEPRLHPYVKEILAEAEAGKTTVWSRWRGGFFVSLLASATLTRHRS